MGSEFWVSHLGLVVRLGATETQEVEILRFSAGSWTDRLLSLSLFPFLHLVNLIAEFGETIINVFVPGGKGCAASEREKQLPQYFRPHSLQKGLGDSSGAEPDSTSPYKAPPTGQAPPQVRQAPPRH